MTVDQAFKEFLESDEYREVAKQNTAIGGKYRLYLSRYNRGLLKIGAIAEILMANGYEIRANKVIKKGKR